MKEHGEKEMHKKNKINRIHMDRMENHMSKGIIAF